jgi:hypothetical protein
VLRYLCMANDSSIKAFMVQVMMREGESESRRSMVSTYQQSHRCFIVLA